MEINPVLTHKFKKDIYNRILLLNNIEHNEIYKIILNNEDNVIYTKNNNGIFINLSKLKENTLIKLDEFLSYCINNKKELDSYDKKVNDCKYNNIVHINFDDKKTFNQPVKEDWNSLAEKHEVNENVSKYIDRVINDNQIIIKKKINTKFNIYRKKYSKPILINDVNLKNNLKKNEYIIS